MKTSVLPTIPMAFTTLCLLSLATAQAPFSPIILPPNRLHAEDIHTNINRCGKPFELNCMTNSDALGGPCCSSDGWCGSSSKYCEQGCQPGYSGPQMCGRHSRSQKAGKTLVSKEGARCGPDHKAACDGLCCSAAGYCGKTEEYCSVPGNCQRAWGWCDSDIMPSGADIRAGKRKYNKKLPEKVDKCTKSKTLALSFDDGPSNYTYQVLDLLKTHGARATFFLAGVNNGHGQLDIAWVDIVKRIVTEGHQIGSHTWSHPNLDKLSSVDRKMEMYKTERAIANIIGKIPTFMRAPMVICGKSCMEDMKALGYHVVGWEVDSQDWQDPQPSVEEATSRLLDEFQKRDNMFLIQHDTSDQAVEVLRNVLENMPSGWSAQPLVECLGHTLDDAFQAPKYLDYKGVKCLVSGPGFCMPTISFHDRVGCLTTVSYQDKMNDACEREAQIHAGGSQPFEHCRHARRVQEATLKFCKECKNEQCDSGRLWFKDL